MTRHVITEKEVSDWANAEAWYEAAMSFGKGSSKRLDMSNDRVFRVSDHDKIVYLGKDLSAAVAAYNDAA